MKLVTAIIRPERANEVLNALYACDVRGLTISEARGHGGELEHVTNYRGATVKMELVNKIRIEIGVSDEFLDRTIEAIMSAARTGEVGDGKIFVKPIERIYRIRTGDQDEKAVTPPGAAR
jgi:nitrogen regulatory protein P-II 1